ncbi:MAG: patatin-like phospholipase family protein [Hydrogenophaga sp.]|jgi:NTE family protein|uniref:patatin-like phospholipase family protein n=1 Tax=Hydrogenophaga sp. TaxID=1904254 RepID=UPI00262BA916|nr:patatin-like phospholipase family protein [Hydrogenophaga sp.]MCV0437643.1 patatin-like phospholipase family protein [Hydrogenophaga sp.]
MALTWRGPPAINLALQGGGAHGAFTWGVLDALLEDGRLRYDGVSGTSAGAMNAVLLAQGLMAGGTQGARDALRGFWSAVAGSLPFEVAVPTADGKNMRLAPAMQLMLQWTHYFSPEQLNPFDLNPLRKILSAQVDFERLRAHCPIKLFVAATNVNTGKLRLFRAPELTPDAVLASACLPTMHRSVVIEGEPYWDGGYAANPAVFPLFHECSARDILLVMLAPLKHSATPQSAADIKSRMMELAFNATFLREMRMFAHLRERAARSTWWRRGELDRRLAGTHFHVIEAGEVMGALSTESKVAANMRFFEMLFALGREHGSAWLSAHHADVGRRSSADLGALFY